MMPILVKKVMTSELEERPRFVTAGYGRQRVNGLKAFRFIDKCSENKSPR